MKAFSRRGSSFKEWLYPDSMELHRNYFMLGDRYGQVFYMQDYASYVKDACKNKRIVFNNLIKVF